jgi:hypothetical protein
MNNTIKIALLSLLMVPHFVQASNAAVNKVLDNMQDLKTQSESLKSKLETNKAKLAAMDPSKLDKKKRASYDDIEKSFPIIEGQIQQLDAAYAHFEQELASILG